MTATVFDFDAAQAELVRWATEVTGWTTVLGEQSQSMPELPYLSLTFQPGPQPYGARETQVWQADGSISWDNDREFIAEIQGRSTKARLGSGTPWEALNALLSSATKRADAFNAVGIALRNRGQIARVPIVEGLSWTNRAVVELTYGYVSQYEDRSTGYFEQVEVNGTVLPNDQTVTTNIP